MEGLTRHFVPLYQTSLNNQKLQSAQLLTPSRPKLTGPVSCALEDFFTSDGSNLGALKQTLIIMLSGFLGIIPIAVAEHFREKRLMESKKIDSYMQEMHVPNPNSDDPKIKNDDAYQYGPPFNWAYHLGASNMALVNKMVLELIKLGDIQQDVLRSVEIQNRSTEFTLMSNLPKFSSLVIESGDFYLSMQGKPRILIMTFGQYITIHQGINLNDTNLSGLQNLREANFVNLYNAELDNVDMSNTDLNGAIFDRMAISRVIFDGANMTGVSMQDSEVTECSMNNIKGVPNTKRSDIDQDTPVSLDLPTWDGMTISEYLTNPESDKNVLVKINNMKSDQQKIAAMRQLVASFKDLDEAAPNRTLLKFFSDNPIYNQDDTIKTFIDNLKKNPDVSIKFSPRNSPTDSLSDGLQIDGSTIDLSDSFPTPRNNSATPRASDKSVTRFTDTSSSTSQLNSSHSRSTNSAIDLPDIPDQED